VPYTIDVDQSGLEELPVVGPDLRQVTLEPHGSVIEVQEPLLGVREVLILLHLRPPCRKILPNPSVQDNEREPVGQYPEVLPNPHVLPTPRHHPRDG